MDTRFFTDINDFTRQAENGLRNGEFLPFYQPQYNHSSGMVVKAEALARWKHPDFGMLNPSSFVPVMEELGLISDLDMCMFEQVCGLLKKCREEGIVTVPVSVNFSRRDIFRPGFIDAAESIRLAYKVPAESIHIEITESCAVEDPFSLQRAVNLFHKYGYIVEMDDFGSGYSSLNVLKDIDFDVLKLDMSFLSGKINAKAGTILSSVIRMAKWLNMTVVSEGVETSEQADYLESLGCDCVQGFLYSPPVPEDDFIKLLKIDKVVRDTPKPRPIVDPISFWDPNSIESYMFSRFIGPACLLSFKSDDTVEPVKVNKKYLKEFGMNLNESQVITAGSFYGFDEESKTNYINMLKTVIETGEEGECDSWRTLDSPSCGRERLCMHSNVRLIGKSDGEYLFFVTVKNVTMEKNYLEMIKHGGRSADIEGSDHEVFYWEYDILNKNMIPCFRCMKTLGMPPLVCNYPQILFDKHLVSEEYMKIYSDLHKQLEKGLPGFDITIPFTDDQVPFHIRYTTVFDEGGRAVKAYCSGEITGGKKE